MDIVYVAVVRIVSVDGVLCVTIVAVTIGDVVPLRCLSGRLPSPAHIVVSAFPPRFLLSRSAVSAIIRSAISIALRAYPICHMAARVD